MSNSGLIKIGDNPLSLRNEESHRYIQHATSENTRKAYQADIRHFMNWGGLLPTTADQVIQYIEALCNEPKSKDFGKTDHCSQELAYIPRIPRPNRSSIGN